MGFNSGFKGLNVLWCEPGQPSQYSD